jgi:hypothetical protein
MYEEDDLKQRRSLIRLGFAEADLNSGKVQDCFEWNVFLASHRRTEVSDLIQSLQFIPLMPYFLIIDSSSFLCRSFLNLSSCQLNCVPRSRRILRYVILIMITLL